MGKNEAGKKVEYIIDDSPIVIPEYIKNMSKEERDAAIAELERKGREERNRLRRERGSTLT